MTEGFSTAERRGAGAGLRGRHGPAEHQAQQRPPAGDLAGGRGHAGELHRLPQAGDHAAPRRAISLYASADRCRDCRACLTACPTQALRVRDGRPMRAGASLHRVHPVHRRLHQRRADGAGRPLVAGRRCRPRRDRRSWCPPRCWPGVEPDYPPVQVLPPWGAWASPRSAPWRRSRRLCVSGAGGGERRDDRRRPRRRRRPAPAPARRPPRRAAAGHRPRLPGHREPRRARSSRRWSARWRRSIRPGRQSQALEREAARWPASSPVPASARCLPQRRDRRPRGCAVAAAECLLPEAIRAAADAGTDRRRRGATDAAERRRGADRRLAAQSAGADFGDDGLLVVSGIRHVMAVLEEIENGLLEDVTALEAYACEGGCFGSPLLFEDHHVAYRRWTEAGRRSRRPPSRTVATDGRVPGGCGPAAPVRGPARHPARPRHGAGHPEARPPAGDHPLAARPGLRRLRRPHLCGSGRRRRHGAGRRRTVPLYRLRKGGRGLMRLHELAEALDLQRAHSCHRRRPTPRSPTAMPPTCSATSWLTRLRAGCW